VHGNFRDAIPNELSWSAVLQKFRSESIFYKSLSYILFWFQLVSFASMT